MELKGSKTEKNLMEAFAGESMARNKYTYYASKAKKEGYNIIADKFEQTANNEKEHAKIWFKLLHDGAVPDTKSLISLRPLAKLKKATKRDIRLCSTLWLKAKSLNGRQKLPGNALTAVTA